MELWDILNIQRIWRYEPNLMLRLWFNRITDGRILDDGNILYSSFRNHLCLLNEDLEEKDILPFSEPELKRILEVKEKIVTTTLHSVYLLEKNRETDRMEIKNRITFQGNPYVTPFYEVNLKYLEKDDLFIIPFPNLITFIKFDGFYISKQINVSNCGIYTILPNNKLIFGLDQRFYFNGFSSLDPYTIVSKEKYNMGVLDLKSFEYQCLEPLTKNSNFYFSTFNEKITLCASADSFYFIDNTSL